MNGAEMIAAERQRQIHEEGWTLDHDQLYDGELLGAANYYLGAAALRRQGESNDRIRRVLLDLPANPWPWSPETFKPRDDVRDLVRAGALIAAELDRIYAGGKS